MGESDQLVQTYGLSQAELSETKPTMRDDLLARRSRYERALNDVKEAIDALDKNPEIEKLHDLLNRALRHRF